MSPFLEGGETVYHRRRKEVVVRAWPRMSSVPAQHDPLFDKWALAQLRLFKPFRMMDELRAPTVAGVFLQHLASGGFPHLRDEEDNAAAEGDSESDADIGPIEPPSLERRLRQDDYQQLMNRGRVDFVTTPLLGMRELDTIRPWPASWHGISFDLLLKWILDTKASTELPPPPVIPVPRSALSKQQRAAFDLIYEHTFGLSRAEQLLLIIIGTAGTGKSFLINAVRWLFDEQECAQSLKVTAPTGIAAANIRGSTIFSLLSLLNHNLSGERLHRLQTVMKDVKLLIIDEYSFLSVVTIDTLDSHLRKIFPQVPHPFGGLNIVFCGDPAQLAPVRAQPVYAHRGPTRFHLFDKVVELDQPFRQAGNDETQKRFRLLLGRVADCDGTSEDWTWLQSRRASCLSAADNTLFDASKYIVATNDMRNHINYEKLSALSPVMRITPSKEGVCIFDEDDLDGERVESDGQQLYAVGAEVMLTANLWTEAGLVNGACGKVISILKPQDDRNARIIMVDFPGYRGPALLPEQPSVLPITQIRTPNCKGMPLTLAWAITIHKAQGMTMSRVTIDLGHKEFASGLTFVALSRAKSFYGLRVLPFDLDRYSNIGNGKHVEARREEFRRLRHIATTTAASA